MVERLEVMLRWQRGPLCRMAEEESLAELGWDPT